MPQPRERMSRVDTAWLRMDNDVNLMMIVGVWLLTPAIALRRRCAERVDDKLLQLRPLPPAGGATTRSARAGCDDADFDIRRHVVREKLRARAAARASARRCRSASASSRTTPLDPARPLWQFHLIEDYEGGSAPDRAHPPLHRRRHRADLGDDVDHRRRRRAAAARARRRDADDGDDWLADAVVKPLTDLAVEGARRCTATASRKSLEMLANPQQGAGSARSTWRASAYQVMSDVAAMALMADDSPTRLKGKPSGRKRVAWGEPMPLDEVKAVGKALGCSINDVLLACVAGAIGAYLRDAGRRPGRQGDPRDGAGEPAPARRGLAARQPLRPRAAGAADRHRQPGRARLRGARAHERAEGQLPAAARVRACWRSPGLLVKPVQDALLGLFAKKATAVMTNVPGPARAAQVLRLDAAADDVLGAGVGRHRRRRQHPQSYGGGVQFGLITDAGAVPRPAGDHRPLRARVREAAAADADAAVGRVSGARSARRRSSLDGGSHRAGSDRVAVGSTPAHHRTAELLRRTARASSEPEVRDRYLRRAGRSSRDRASSLPRQIGRSHRALASVEGERDGVEMPQCPGSRLITIHAANQPACAPGTMALPAKRETGRRSGRRGCGAPARRALERVDRARSARSSSVDRAPGARRGRRWASRSGDGLRTTIMADHPGARRGDGSTEAPAAQSSSSAFAISTSSRSIASIGSQPAASS